MLSSVRIVRNKMTHIKSYETACKCCRKKEGRDHEFMGIPTGFIEERELEAGRTCLGKDDSGKRTPGRWPRAPSEVLELVSLAHRSIPRAWNSAWQSVCVQSRGCMNAGERRCWHTGAGGLLGALVFQGKASWKHVKRRRLVLLNQSDCIRTWWEMRLNS